MKYEIEIDDSLVPEGKVPVSLSRDRTTMLELKFKEVHVPKIPDFVPEGHWITKDNDGEIEVFKTKPRFNGECWLQGAEVSEVTDLHFDRDALFGDLPPEHCCFQQKGKEPND